jgi:protein Mpv17
MAWYNGWLDRSPLLTKSITSAVLFGLGDVIAQFVSGGLQFQFDVPRFFRASAFGCFLLGPLAHIHYNFLDWLVVHRLAVGAAAMPFVKMFIDQFTYWAPGINVVYHFSLGMMEGKGVDGSVERVKDKIIPTLKANYLLWPAVQIINFKFVPVAHQLNLILVVSLGWAAFLSQLSSGGQEQDKKSD